MSNSAFPPPPPPSSNSGPHTPPAGPTPQQPATPPQHNTPPNYGQPPQPYGQPPQPYGQPPQPPESPFAPYSRPEQVNPDERSRAWVTIGIPVGMLVLLLLGGLIFLGITFLKPAAVDTPPAAAPTSTPNSASTPPPSAADDPEEAEKPTESVPNGSINADNIREYLEDTIDSYKASYTNGSLWQKIPQNEFNTTAYQAFIFFLTDMKAATLWGIDDATAQRYYERTQELEELFLSETPLGDDITITFSEDRVFRYDGTTGEGGYTDE